MVQNFDNELFKDLNLEEVDPRDLPLVTTVDESTILKEQIRQNKQSSTFLQSLGASIQEEWIAPTIVNNWDRITDTDGTPITSFTPELVKELTQGLEDRTAVREVIEKAQTSGLNSAIKTRDSYLKTQANLKQVADGGFTGATANAFAVMFDPVEWAAILGTSAAVSAVGTPVAGAATLTAGAAKKAYNVGRAFKIGAAVGAAESAAFEAVRAQFRYDIDGNDVILAGAIGAGLGGGINAGLTGFAKAGTRAKLAKKVAQGFELTPSERAFYDANNVDTLAARIISSELQGDKFIEAIDGLPTKRADQTTLTTKDVEQIPEIEGIWGTGKLRKLIGVGYTLASSPMGWARYSARALGMNSVGYRGGKLETGGSASEIAELLQLRFRNKIAAIMPSQQTLWTKRTGGKIADFNTLVSRYVRGIDTEEVPIEVKKAGDALNKIQRELADEAVKYDVAGFSSKILNTHPNYMTRVFNDEKIRDMRSRLGDDEKLDDLIEHAIRTGQPKLNTDLDKYYKKNKKKKTGKNVVRQIARAYRQYITDPNLGKMGHAGANEMNLEDFADILEKGGIDKDEIDAITDLLVRTNIPKANNRARHRIVLNEGATLKLQNADGTIQDYRFADLLEEDAEQLVNSYIFQLSGAIGLARNGINTNQADSSFNTLISKIKFEGKEKNLSNQEISEAVEAAEFMYDGITGRLAQRSDVSNNTRDFNIALRAFSFAVNMGMSGMSALMELSNVLFETSFKTLLRTAPAYGRLLNRARAGQDPELLDELIDAFGVGDEVALGKWNNVTRYDTDDSIGVISPERAWGDKRGWSTRAIRGTERVAKEAQKKVAYWSGLTGVTQVLRRMSMLNFTNEFALKAAQGKVPFSLAKRQQLGLSEDMANKIRDVMNSNIVQKKPNGTIAKLNIDRWDADVREAFELAGFKDARLNVQETNIASSNKWLRSSEVGKTMFQFLNFTMASLEQQSMRLGVRLKRGDIAVAKVVMGAVAMGTLMYITRVHLNAANRSDADEYIKRALAPEKVVGGALSQIGAASIFSYILQITTGAMNGNTYAITPPAFSLYSGVAQTGKNLFETSFLGDDFTETEFRKALRILPFQSLYGARQILNGVATLAD